LLCITARTETQRENSAAQQLMPFPFGRCRLCWSRRQHWQQIANEKFKKSTRRYSKQRRQSIQQKILTVKLLV